jgi:hypothetical protein
MIVKELFARLGVKVDSASVGKGEKAFDKIKAAAVAVAGVLVAGKVAKGFTDLAFSVAAAGDDIAKTSKQIGVNAQALQELQFAAGLAGASTSDLNTGLRLLQKNALEASQGTKSFVEDFDRLGVKVRDSNGRLKSAEVLLMEVSSGMQNLKSSTERTALAQTLLGRSGTKLIPLLNQGADAIARQREEARALGGVYSDELLGQSEELVDAQLRYETASRGVRNVLAAVLIPTMTKLLNFMARIVASIARFIKGTKLFQVVITGFAAAVSAFAIVLVGKLVAAFASVATVSVAAAGGVSSVGTAALIAQAKALLLGAAFLVLLGILLLIGDEIATALAGGDTLGRRFGDLLSDLSDTFLKLKTTSPVLNALLAPLKVMLRLLIGIKDTLFAIILALTGDFSGFSIILSDEEKKKIEGVTGRIGKLFGRALEAAGPLVPGFAEGLIGRQTVGRSPSVIGGRTSTRSVSVGEITVNAAPGQSPTDVAVEVRRQMETILDDRDAEDEQLLVPAQAGAVR